MCPPSHCPDRNQAKRIPPYQDAQHNERHLAELHRPEPQFALQLEEETSNTMSTPTRKAILTATLAPSTSPSPSSQSRFGTPDQVKAMVLASVEEATSAGFDISGIALNPADASSSLETLRDKLQSQHWDGFLIGFAVRGNKDYTPLFEAAVNACREIRPEARMLFGNAPNDLVKTLRRNWPEGKE